MQQPGLSIPTRMSEGRRPASHRRMVMSPSSCVHLMTNCSRASPPTSASKASDVLGPTARVRGLVGPVPEAEWVEQDRHRQRANVGLAQSARAAPAEQLRRSSSTVASSRGPTSSILPVAPAQVELPVTDVAAYSAALQAAAEALRDDDPNSALALIRDSGVPATDRNAAEEAGKHGIQVVLEPGGALRSSEVETAAAAYGMTLVRTQNRYFYH